MIYCSNKVLIYRLQVRLGKGDDLGAFSVRFFDTNHIFFFVIFHVQKNITFTFILLA